MISNIARTRWKTWKQQEMQAEPEQDEQDLMSSKRPRKDQADTQPERSKESIGREQYRRKAT